MIPYKQLSLADILRTNHSSFLCLNNTLTSVSIYPLPFTTTIMHHRAHPYIPPDCLYLDSDHPKNIFDPTDQLLLVFLHYSKLLRDFCGFKKVPDASKITRFKQDFLPDLQSVFDNLVDVTEPICQAIDAAKADMAIFDSSGIEAFVRENNPKYAFPRLFKPGNKTTLCQWTFLLCVQVWHCYKRSGNHPPYFFL